MGRQDDAGRAPPPPAAAEICRLQYSHRKKAKPLKSDILSILLIFAPPANIVSVLAARRVFLELGTNIARTRSYPNGAK
jgi:hypothetical protein